MSKTYLLKKKQYLLRFSVHVILFELPLPLPILMMSLNNNKKMWTYISSEEIVKWKQVLRPCLFLLQRKKYFNFFIQLTQRKKSVVWHLLSSKERKITKLYVYEWRKRRHAPIVMHKIIVFLKTYYGKYICVLVNICNQYEASFLLK